MKDKSETVKKTQKEKRTRGGEEDEFGWQVCGLVSERTRSFPKETKGAR